MKIITLELSCFVFRAVDSSRWAFPFTGQYLWPIVLVAETKPCQSFNAVHLENLYSSLRDTRQKAGKNDTGLNIVMVIRESGASVGD